MAYNDHCIPSPLHTSTVLSLKAMVANTRERINTVNASAVPWTLHSCTVINVSAAVPSTIASKTLTSVVSNTILYEKNNECHGVVASRQIWQEVVTLEVMYLSSMGKLL